MRKFLKKYSDVIEFLLVVGVALCLTAIIWLL